jgi:hypothetical protein
MRTMKPSPADLTGSAYRQHPDLAGIVGHWLMNEGGGLTAYDWSGQGNHGTLTGMDPPTDWVMGQFGYALDFDGTNDYVNLGTKVDANYSAGQITMSAWIKTAVTGKWILHDFVTPTFDIGIWVESSGGNGKLALAVSDQTRSTGTTRIDDNVFHHVAATFDKITIRLYVDGRLDQTTSFSNAGWLTSGDSMGIGGPSSGGVGYFNGIIDDVRIYNRVLTPGEVMEMYRNPFRPFLRRRWLGFSPAAPPVGAASQRMRRGMG